MAINIKAGANSNRSLTAGSSKKQSLYLGAKMARDLEVEAVRLDRSMSWVIRHLWEHCSDTIREIPTPGRGTP